MKPDGVLTNTSRSNEDDLLVHLKSNTSFWYGTDIFNGKPVGTKRLLLSKRIAQQPRVYSYQN